MGKAMYEERTYERKQEIEIRAARGGNVQSWVRAKIDSLTSKGAHVTILGSGRSTHIGWRDMRKIGAVTEPVVEQEPSVAAPTRPTLSNPVLSAEAADKLKAEVKPIATVTTIKPPEKEPIVVAENQQRLVNVSKPRKLANAPRLPSASNALVAGLLVNAREQENLTRNDLAELLGVSLATVMRVERGEDAPDDDLLIAYNEKLDLDLELLMLARDNPEEARNYRPTPKVPPPPPPAPTFPSPKNVRIAPVGLTPSSSVVEIAVTPPPLAAPKPAPPALDIGDFFEFCDQMELICPQPAEPALRKRWRELAQGLFDLRSKL